MKWVLTATLVLCVLLMCALGTSLQDDVERGINRDDRSITRGTTLYVGPNQTYKRIQDAINNASQGDTVRVYAGIYNENVILHSNDINLIGNGSMKTTIQSSMGTTLTVYGNQVNISGFNITPSMDVNSYYSRIEDIHLYSPNPSYSNKNVVQGANLIFNNISFINYDIGISLMSGSECNITNCSFIKCDYGIVFYCGSSNCGIEYNNFSFNGRAITNYGYYPDYCGDFFIRNNSFFHNNENINFSWMTNGFFQDNTFQNLKNNVGYNGISLWGCENCYMSNNTFKNAGLDIMSYNLDHNLESVNHHIDSSNTVNDKPIYYLNNRKDISLPQEIGQLFLVNCSNIRITDRDFSFSSFAIYDYNSNNLTISNNTFYNISACIRSVKSNYSTIENNTMSNGTWGIDYRYSYNNLFSNNKISNYGIGIRISGNVNSILFNQLSNDGRTDYFYTYKMIDVYGSNNTFEGNAIKGEYRPHWESTIHYGLSIDGDNNQVINNTIIECRKGLVFSTSDNNLIKLNNIRNAEYGVYLDEYGGGRESGKNLFYLNNFYNNTQNARDRGEQTKWDNSLYGNYWDGHTTPDDNNDGFVDIPYYIYGGFEDGPKDNLPLVKPSVTRPNYAPIISMSDLIACFEDTQLTYEINAEDYDGDPIVWTFYTNASWLSLNSDSGIISGTPPSNSSETYWGYISIEDDRGESDSKNFTIMVLPVDDDPVFYQAIPSISIFEDEEITKAIDLWQYVIDAETPHSQLRFHIINNSNPKCGISIDSERWIDVDPWEDWHGISLIKIQVDDGLNCGYGYFLVNVLSVEDPPLLNDSVILSKITMTEDTVYQLEDIGDWFYDVDGDHLYYLFDSGHNITVKERSSRKFELMPKTNWVGVENINFQCSDGTFKVNHSIRVEVTQVNDPPFDIQIIVEQCDYDGSFYLQGWADDVDLVYGDHLTYSWITSISDLRICGVCIHSIDLPEGFQIITLTVSDNKGASIHTTITIDNIFEEAENETQTDDDVNTTVIVPSNDLDEDGLPDDWEINYFGDLSQGPYDDFDKDGLSNFEELKYRMDPSVPIESSKAKQNKISTEKTQESFDSFLIIASIILTAIPVIIVGVGVFLFIRYDRKRVKKIDVAHRDPALDDSIPGKKEPEFEIGPGIIIKEYDGFDLLTEESDNPANPIFFQEITPVMMDESEGVFESIDEDEPYDEY